MDNCSFGYIETQNPDNGSYTQIMKVDCPAEPNRYFDFKILMLKSEWKEHVYEWFN